jgi:NAD(P)-dependent dehydrogenase (short-subunit alcohol dehydrogenase family)
MAGAVVIGAGPGIGRSVALRFAREGMPVAVAARTSGTVQALAEEIEQKAGTPALALTVDVTDEAALRQALEDAEKAFGPPDVMVYNAAIIRPDRPGELSVREHQEAWAVNVVGAVNAAAHVLPGMAERGRGTYIITGGMPEAIPSYVSLSLGKAGVRTLVELLDIEYGESGVHVATVTVAGAVAPGTDFDPDDIAEHYWDLHVQPRDGWQREITHGPRGDRAGH